MNINSFSGELNFLVNIPFLNNNDNRDTIWNHLYNKINITEFDPSAINKTEYKLSAAQKNPKRVVVFKEKVGEHKNIQNYYNDTIYKEKYKENIKNNPYLDLITQFSGKDYSGLSLEAADFAYLTHLGVYPINRLWILRRYKDGVVVPDNLTELSEAGTNQKGIYPISTIVGWVSPEEENFLDLDFNEVWKTQTDRVDEVIQKMIQNSTKNDKKENAGIDISTILPSGTAFEGIMLGILNEMGLTNFSATDNPQGNPNVLQEAATRITEPGGTEMGLSSTISFTLKTSYEQKFIGDVDPGSAMLDIISRLTTMGTSDMIFFSNKNNSLFKEIRDAGNSNDWYKWYEVFKNFVLDFLRATWNLVKATSKSLYDNPLETISKAGDALISSTFSKWEWPLRAGLGVMTGENTTPWHLTIGNPKSPFFSTGNIKVSKVDLKFNNELGFNDIPTRLDVSITTSMGRNLGAQEILSKFNNNFLRVYDTETTDYFSITKLVNPMHASPVTQTKEDKARITKAYNSPETKTMEVNIDSSNETYATYVLEGEEMRLDKISKRIYGSNYIEELMQINNILNIWNINIGDKIEFSEINNLSNLRKLVIEVDDIFEEISKQNKNTRVDPERRINVPPTIKPKNFKNIEYDKNTNTIIIKGKLS